METDFDAWVRDQANRRRAQPSGGVATAELDDWIAKQKATRSGQRPAINDPDFSRQLNAEAGLTTNPGGVLSSDEILGAPDPSTLGRPVRVAQPSLTDHVGIARRELANIREQHGDSPESWPADRQEWLGHHTKLLQDNPSIDAKNFETGFLAEKAHPFLEAKRPVGERIEEFARSRAKSSAFDVRALSEGDPLDEALAEFKQKFPGETLPREKLEKLRNYYRLAAQLHGEEKGPRKDWSTELGLDPAKVLEIAKSIPRPTSLDDPNIGERELFASILKEYADDTKKRRAEASFVDKANTRLYRGVNEIVDIPGGVKSLVSPDHDRSYAVQLRDIVRGGDPATSDSFVEGGALGAVGMVPSLGASAVTGGTAGMAARGLGGTAKVAEAATKVGSTAYWWSRTAPGLSDNLKQNGVDGPTARIVGSLAAIPIAAIENLQTEQLAEPLKRQIVANVQNQMEEYAGRLVKTYGKELGEEALQGVMEFGAKVVASELSSAKPHFDWSNEVGQFVDEMKSAAISLPFLMAPGALGGAYRVQSEQAQKPSPQIESSQSSSAPAEEVPYAPQVAGTPSAPAREQDPATESTGVPFVFTRAMKQSLRDMGYGDEDIRHLNPQQAHDLINSGKVKESVAQPPAAPTWREVKDSKESLAAWMRANPDAAEAVAKVQGPPSRIAMADAGLDVEGSTLKERRRIVGNVRRELPTLRKELASREQQIEASRVSSNSEVGTRSNALDERGVPMTSESSEVVGTRVATRGESEPAPEVTQPTEKVEPPRRVSRVSVENAFPNQQLEDLPDGQGWRVNLVNGRSFTVQPVDDFGAVDRQAAERSVGRALTDDEFANFKPRGSWQVSLPDGQKINGVGLMRLVNGRADDATVRHEALHVARSLGLFNDSEWRALADKHAKDAETDGAAEERIARSYEAWTGPDGLWERVKRFLNDVLSRLGIASPTADTALSRIASGEVFGRPAKVESRPQAAERLAGGVRYQAEPMAPVYYDNILHSLDTWQAKGAPAQLRAHLAKTKGTADQMKWIGLDDWLADKPSVTKADVEAFVNSNRLEVREVIKQQKPRIFGKADAIEYLKSQGIADPEAEYGYKNDDDYTALANQMGRDNNPRFGQYQVPGGENYRELLITLPSGTSKDTEDARDAWRIARNTLGDAEDSGLADSELARFRESVESAKANYYKAEKAEREAFKSTHFDEPNVLAHVRFNERTDAEGKRVLFLEEVQSDWHQHGRKQGYKSKTPTELPPGIVAAQGSNGRWYLGDSERHARNAEHTGNGFATREQAIVAAHDPQGDKVPDAPFKQTWPALVMRRMVRYASEHGFDRIAWTTGDQQAERYDLAKQVNAITFARHKNGTYELSAGLPGGGSAVLADRLSSERLDEFVGKDLAAKIRNEQKNIATYSGLDLKVGGDGMKGFYDKLLPAEVNKFAKRWGAKVSTTTIGREVRNEMDLSSLGAEKLADDSTRFAEQGTVHSLDITPEMKKSVLSEGVPLYAGDVEQDRQPVESLYSKSRRGTNPTLRSWLKFAFTSRGDLPPEAFTGKEQVSQYVASHEEAMRQAMRDFKRAATKAYGSPELGDAQLAALNEAVRGGDLEAIPQLMRDPVRRMRDHVDHLSKKLIESGATTDSLALTIESNLGTYLTRTYRVFSDPKWAEKVPAEVRNKFKAWLTAENPDLSPQQIDQQTNELLYSGKAAESPISILNRSKLGAKILDVMKERKNVPPELRELWGEETDPMISYAASISKMARLIANQKFLTEMRDAGLGRWLWSASDRDIDPQASAVIAAEGSSVMSPLNGLRTFPEIKKAFETEFEHKHISPLFRYYLRINGAIKAAKTVGSVITQIRNFSGNIAFQVANGNYRVNKLGEAFKGSIPKLEDFGFKTSDEWRDFHRKLIGLGVLDENIAYGELHDLLKDAAGDTFWTRSDNTLIKLARAGLKNVGDLYQTEDNFWKIYAWANERAKYAKAFPEWSDNVLDRRAAEIVRNTMPTYSRIPKGVQAFRRLPVGNFVSWPAEVIRTTLKTLELAKTELRDHRTRAIGAQRLVGILSMAALPKALTSFFALLYGITPEEDEDRRRFVPPWSRQSDLLWLNDGAYVDMAYSDPHSYIRKPLYAMLRSDDPVAGVAGAIGELASPFVSEQFLLEKISDVTLRGGKTNDGREVFNPADSDAHKAYAAAKHILAALVPSAVGQVRDVFKGVTGEVDANGKKYDPALEFTALVSGTRISKFSVAASYPFKARAYSQTVRDASRILNTVAMQRGPASVEEIQSAYRRANSARHKAFTELHRDTWAAMRLGMSEDDVRASLKSAGISEANVDHLISGTFPPYKPTRDWVEVVTSRADGAQRLRTVENEWIAASADPDEAKKELEADKDHRYAVIQAELERKPAPMTIKENESYDDFEKRVGEVRQHRQRLRRELETIEAKPE